MTTIDLNAQDGLELEVRRTEDEYGWIELRLATIESERVKITVGRFYDDAASLADTLESAAKEARSIVNEWKDLPDENDGFVFDGRKGYSVQLEGCHWNGDALMLDPKRQWRDFPTRDIATYELAAAMSSSGVFPNVWYQDERGWSDNISDDVGKYHDEGGDKLLPLEGVEYEDGAGISVLDARDGSWGAYVVKDYGNLGIVYVLSGDDTEHFTDDRSIVSAREDDDE